MDKRAAEKIVNYANILIAASAKHSSDHEFEDPTVRVMFEHGHIIAPASWGLTHRAKEYGKRRSLGDWLGIAPTREGDDYPGPFMGVSIYETSPRRIRYEHRMKLKAKLPGKHKSLITYAKRLTQKRFIEQKVSPSIAALIMDRTGLEPREFWRQVRYGPTGKSKS